MQNLNTQNISENEIFHIQKIFNDSIKSLYKDNNSLEEFEKILIELKKKVLRNIMTSITSVIDRVIEDGSVNFQGENKQFNISSVRLVNEEKIFLEGREILGIDLQDKKYVLDNEITLIDFSKVIKIY